ncbi:hypothetical protein DFR24_0732 [Panacagrimonas perspica]|uniref:Uncharacterized protein n=1 Tax=Panacagrimonas perspica TaxID=381431 RepID=A0A4S3JYW2_9GAMM|nr:hypothetical protein [Panacagrimonas perspica]TDU31364.1 hypothetical protein DFR24_0732 [Panacagrimonas perspica]THD00777.1 hypothetical protein B1810_22920 [Panacagrimonas perspica]
MKHLARKLIAVSIPACVLLSSPAVHAADVAPVQPQAGVTIMGDRDSALGLFLAPWKEEERADLGRPPGLQDPGLAPVDPDGFARTTTYYQTGRAYRAERLQRNR